MKILRKERTLIEMFPSSNALVSVPPVSGTHTAPGLLEGGEEKQDAAAAAVYHRRTAEAQDTPDVDPGASGGSRPRLAGNKGVKVLPSAALLTGEVNWLR